MCINSKGKTCNNWQTCLVLQPPDPDQACPSVDCSTKTTCGSCAASDGCGWCASTQSCIEGDSSVNICKDCSDNFFCFKTDPDGFESQCPKTVCSSHTKCSECSSEPGCGWDARRLSCVELQKSAVGSCESTTDRGCIYSPSGSDSELAATPAKCPSTPNELCSDYSDCRACTQDEMCGWSVDGKCVEASTSLGSACRGIEGLFSYWDCEPHCQSLGSCEECLADTNGCTMCSAELLDQYSPKISRCVLAKGARFGPGNQSMTEYNHSCAAVHDTISLCSRCSRHDLPPRMAVRSMEASSDDLSAGDSLGRDDLGSGLPSPPPPPPPPPGDVSLACSSCVADPECGACIAPPSPPGPYNHSDLRCVYGDRDGPYGSSCSDLEPPERKLQGGVPYWVQSSQSASSVCNATDICSTLTSCDLCLSAHALGCTWCNETLPLQDSPLSPCRPVASCPVEFRQEPFTCPDHSCESLNVSCTECVARHSCAWGGGGCITSTNSFSSSHFPFVWAEPPKCPEVCGAHTSCGECAASDGCGWCNGVCLPANGTEPDYRATGIRCSPFYTAANQNECGSSRHSGSISPAVIALASVGGILVVGIAASFAAKAICGTTLTALVMGVGHRPEANPLWLGPSDTAGDDLLGSGSVQQGVAAGGSSAGAGYVAPEEPLVAAPATAPAPVHPASNEDRSAQQQASRPGWP
jgi:hypothetical protein